MQVFYPPADFEREVNEAYRNGANLVDGYAPFWFVALDSFVVSLVDVSTDKIMFSVFLNGFTVSTYSSQTLPMLSVDTFLSLLKTLI